MTNPSISIYIDEGFDADSLQHLLAQVTDMARNAWYSHIEDQVDSTYRRLARSEVKEGRASPADFPDLSIGLFDPPLPYDVISDSLLELWEKRLVEEVSSPALLSFKPTTEKETTNVCIRIEPGPKPNPND